MRADTAGVLLIAKTAARFAWTWTRGDLALFANEMGWRIVKVGSISARLETGFSIDRPTARVDFGGLFFDEWNDQIATFTIYVADLVAPAGCFTSDVVDPSESLATFVSVAQQIQPELGIPSLHEDQSAAEFRWDTDTVVIKVVLDKGATMMKLSNPRIQDWLDNLSEEDDC